MCISWSCAWLVAVCDQVQQAWRPVVGLHSATAISGHEGSQVLLTEQLASGIVARGAPGATSAPWLTCTRGCPTMAHKLRLSRAAGWAGMRRGPHTWNVLDMMRGPTFFCYSVLHECVNDLEQRSPAQLGPIGQQYIWTTGLGCTLTQELYIH